MSEHQPLLLVLGVGNPDWGDDRVGPAVAERIQNANNDSVEARSVFGELFDLMVAMKGHRQAVIVTAIRSHGAEGALHVFDASKSPLPTELFGNFATHDFGLPEALELIRTLGELPPKLIVLGIEGRDSTPLASMSPRVREAIEEASRWIVERAEAYALKPIA
ncbi:hydrogenase maturation protease [Pelagicoccus sp. SDUM812003]|uniref:hydrogenase maturation protease n=1 Tax=Pelagicoccus sp. SDUM812003 TaxID=3041267 RepID=UPI00280E72B0|nr:hydrogenase maturation protease [Pelagicoccus sp. SDUM812003]MDQ8202073.1 hydrogenase maturation protease [Pelagicoccus sp. SDUM812003]